MDAFQVYKDMKARTNGEIYIGVVGPVRTGKSTFIKRFMDLLVLPNMTDEHAKERTKDELPQSASGTTIMTTEPKFVPKDAASVRLSEDVEVKIRLIDCVGYMVDGASGHIENDVERQVKTPWFEHDITTDGSIGELPRENYILAEEKTIQELKSIGKPFLILLNTQKPYSEETKSLQGKMEEKYGVSVLAVNCAQLRTEDINQIMRQVLYEFPISEAEFYIPKWVEMLPKDHPVKSEVLSSVRNLLDGMDDIRSVAEAVPVSDSEYIEKIRISQIEMDTGIVKIQMDLKEKYYYEVLSELTGTKIQGEYELIAAMKELAAMKEEYTQIKDAFADVKMKGYGVVSPKKEEILLDEPAIIKQGSKYGVKIRSEAPSVHMIRANIETEIAPIVGSEKQAQDLVEYIKAESETPEGVWGTNIFGKSVEELVLDGMRNKINMINEESQVKLQDTMQKIVNDSNGGLVCIII